MIVVDLAWVAGFFEGEAHFALNRMRVSVSQVQREPLDRLLLMFGGKISARTQKHANWNSYHDWTISGPKAALVMMAVYPLMSPNRQQRIEQSMANWMLTPTYQRECDKSRYTLALQPPLANLTL